MNLYLLRHGDAVETGYDDAQRPLSPAGEVQARIVAAYLQKTGNVPGVILSSPLVRAMQMAVIIGEQLKIGGPVRSEYLVPGADHRQILQELNRLGASSVLLVGHEPHLQTFTSLLVRGDRLGSYPYKKSSLACVEVGTPVVPGGGKLRWLLPAEQMKT